MARSGTLYFALLTVAALNAATVNAPRRAVVRYNAAAVNNPATTDQLGPGDKGSAALRAQILLMHAHFSVGEIDGSMGDNTLQALAGFEEARGLPAPNFIDNKRWQGLHSDQSPVLTSYTITAADLKGPFVTVPTDMLAKAKLQYLGYASPLEELAEK